MCLFFSLTGNGLGIRVVGGKEVPGSNGEIGAYVAKVLPGGAAEQTGKILEGNFYLEFSKKTKKQKKPPPGNNYPRKKCLTPANRELYLRGC